MQKPPLSVIEAWPRPNYVDPVTRGNENIVLNIVLYIFLMLFVGLRIITRTFVKRAFGADDALILAAIIPTTAFFVINVLADTRYLWIRHQYDIPPDHVVTGLKMVLGAEIAFAAACTLTKLSMLMLFRRLLVSSTLLWRRITVLAMIVVGIQGSVFIITVIFQCRPPQDYWKITSEPQPNCINQSSSLLVAGIVNTLTDFTVVLLPIRLVFSLQLPRRQAFVVALLFAFGFLSCFAGVFRTFFMWKVTQTFDMVWASYLVWVTASIELYVGVICASIPATKPFFSIYLPQAFGSMTNSQPSCPDTSQASRNNGTTTSADGKKGDLLELISALEKGYSPSSTIASRADDRR